MRFKESGEGHRYCAEDCSFEILLARVAVSSDEAAAQHAKAAATACLDRPGRNWRTLRPLAQRLPRLFPFSPEVNEVDEAQEACAPEVAAAAVIAELEPRSAAETAVDARQGNLFPLLQLDVDASRGVPDPFLALGAVFAWSGGLLGLRFLRFPTRDDERDGALRPAKAAGDRVPQLGHGEFEPFTHDHYFCH